MSDNNQNYLVELFIKTLNKKHNLVFEKEKEEYFWDYAATSRSSSTPTSMDRAMPNNSGTTSPPAWITPEPSTSSHRKLSSGRPRLPK